ncbi:MAG: hypothetical protein M1826_002668 [Phylliscum demangeonii]|nr:MAG: hypothetical protein M1826_002668 [Phylliscum demangeonii]
MSIPKRIIPVWLTSPITALKTGLCCSGPVAFNAAANLALPGKLFSSLGLSSPIGGLEKPRSSTFNRALAKVLFPMMDQATPSARLIKDEDLPEPYFMGDEIESWDADGDLQFDGIELSSSATVNACVRPRTRQNSLSSRLSHKSDVDSIGGAEDERQVLLRDGDESATDAAIASAINAGIPIPKNVSSSALVGGTIKRLGTKQPRTAIGDDWTEDLEIPANANEPLKLKTCSEPQAPDSLLGLDDFGPDLPTSTDREPEMTDAECRAILAAANDTYRIAPSPRPVYDSTNIPTVKAKKFSSAPTPAALAISARLLTADGDLDDFETLSDLDDFGPDVSTSTAREPEMTQAECRALIAAANDTYGATRSSRPVYGSTVIPTIKAKKDPSAPKPATFATPALLLKADGDPDDFETDLELPNDDAPLQLLTPLIIPSGSLGQPDDVFETATEGSLGTRQGGTRQEVRSPRSASVSVKSPSLSSAYTFEDEDEGLAGLVLPEGPLNLSEVLLNRQQTAEYDVADAVVDTAMPASSPPAEDFFAGLEIGDGPVFDSAKLTLNRNVKHTANKNASPQRRTAMSLTFTNKPTHMVSRIPRLMTGTDRVASTLEPVLEGGDPVTAMRRAPSRLGPVSGSSLPVASTPTPTRPRELRARPSVSNLRVDAPSTQNPQPLKMKRSLPVLRAQHIPFGQPGFGHHMHRPTSSGDQAASGAGRFGQPPSRPKTPLERSGAQSSLGQARKSQPFPFLPPGPLHSQSQHVAVKGPLHRAHRHDSQSSSGTASTNALRTPSPRRKDLAPDSLAREAAAKRTLVQPAKKRHFGNGTELDMFDDLPTSASNENRFVKAPIGRGAPSIRSRLGLQSVQLPPPISSKPEQPAMSSHLRAPPTTPIKRDAALRQPPRFARDTVASRLAREHRTAGAAMGAGPLPLPPMVTSLKNAMAARGPSAVRVKRRHTGAPPRKPQLIKPLAVDGMHYNPDLCRWEGNENALAPFEGAPSAVTATGTMTLASPGLGDIAFPAARAGAVRPSSSKSDMTTVSRPALISSLAGNAASSVQVVGDMVFDPQQMCWLKLSYQQRAAGGGGASMSRDHEDEDDPFAGLDDLEDETKAAQKQSSSPGAATSAAAAIGGETNGDWLGEEFDVGPTYVHRQRDEETRWHRKIGVWASPERTAAAYEWRWGIFRVLKGQQQE